MVYHTWYQHMVYEHMVYTHLLPLLHLLPRDACGDIDHL